MNCIAFVLSVLRAFSSVRTYSSKQKLRQLDIDLFLAFRDRLSDMVIIYFSARGDHRVHDVFTAPQLFHLLGIFVGTLVGAFACISGGAFCLFCLPALGLCSRVASFSEEFQASTV